MQTKQVISTHIVTYTRSLVHILYTGSGNIKLHNIVGCRQINASGHVTSSPAEAVKPLQINIFVLSLKYSSFSFEDVASPLRPVLSGELSSVHLHTEPVK